jgi:hypothetical protein
MAKRTSRHENVKGDIVPVELTGELLGLDLKGDTALVAKIQPAVKARNLLARLFYDRETKCEADKHSGIPLGMKLPGPNRALNLYEDALTNTFKTLQASLLNGIPAEMRDGFLLPEIAEVDHLSDYKLYWLWQADAKDVEEKFPQLIRYFSLFDDKIRERLEFLRTHSPTPQAEPQSVTPGLVRGVSGTLEPETSSPAVPEETSAPEGFHDHPFKLRFLYDALEHEEEFNRCKSCESFRKRIAKMHQEFIHAGRRGYYWVSESRVKGWGIRCPTCDDGNGQNRKSD